jgi:hypothetical protein
LEIAMPDFELFDSHAVNLVADSSVALYSAEECDELLFLNLFYNDADYKEETK